MCTQTQGWLKQAAHGADLSALFDHVLSCSSCCDALLAYAAQRPQSDADGATQLMTLRALSVLFQQPPVYSLPARDVANLFEGIRAFDRSRNIRMANSHLIYEDECADRRTRVYATYDDERCGLHITTEPPQPLRLFMIAGGRTFEQQFDDRGSVVVDVSLDALIAAAGGALAVWIME